MVHNYHGTTWISYSFKQAVSCYCWDGCVLWQKLSYWYKWWYFIFWRRVLGSRRVLLILHLKNENTEIGTCILIWLLSIALNMKDFNVFKMKCICMVRRKDTVAIKLHYHVLVVVIWEASRNCPYVPGCDYSIVHPPCCMFIVQWCINKRVVLLYFLGGDEGVGNGDGLAMRWM